MAEKDTQDTQDVQETALAGQVPRVGDTWEDMSREAEEASGPQRRVGVLEVDGDHAVVENKVTRVQSRVRLDRFVPPAWRFIG